MRGGVPLPRRFGPPVSGFSLAWRSAGRHSKSNGMIDMLGRILRWMRRTRDREQCAVQSRELEEFHTVLDEQLRAQSRKHVEQMEELMRLERVVAEVRADIDERSLEIERELRALEARRTAWRETDRGLH